MSKEIDKLPEDWYDHTQLKFGDNFWIEDLYMKQDRVRHMPIDNGFVEVCGRGVYMESHVNIQKVDLNNTIQRVHLTFDELEAMYLFARGQNHVYSQDYKQEC